MLIPSIDLQGGRVVQLQQGERPVIETDDLDGWLERFARFPIIQVIDLDAAKNTGSNRALVERICRERRCQVGGGVRTPAHAASLLDAGASSVIVGSALFSGGAVQTGTARAFAETVGIERLIAAVDARGTAVAIDGWRTVTPIGVTAAINALEDHVGGFLATLIDGEGMLGGIDMGVISTLRQATRRRLIAAGGIRSHAEVAALEAIGVDAVVGMAIYTGVMTLEAE
ncbi:MAG: 1-(5-phosphoribosyl)-5-[(5-phosphoribosylamino)methylideneamino] imidazole-4-carboxamide isomerase [Acidobacteria bacterium]|nr:MAG: 1-(5-phosphoribosyl)-5-[(5-phosphoribosylamino)methylideneamino] imidazole-4-carboxamide isomerase [Acidobacteriota bacterium]